MDAFTLWPVYASFALGYVTCAVMVRYGATRDPREG